MRIKSLISCILLSLGLTSACSEVSQPTHAPTVLQFSIINSASQAFDNVPMTISRELLPASTLGFFTLSIDDKPIVSQFDDLDQDGQWDEIAFIVSIPAESALTLKLQPITKIPTDAVQQTNIRFAQFNDQSKVQATELVSHTRQSANLSDDYASNYQMEGPAWENDLIGFRLYFDERNGFDIFGKTSSEMVLDQVGIQQNYHELQNWGMDILKVGRSLGAGALAVVNNRNATEQITRLSMAEQTSVKVITEGPVRSIFAIEYNNVPIAGELHQLSQRISIWAGQHYYQSELQHSFDDNDLQIASGIVNFNELQPLLTEVSSHSSGPNIMVHASFGVQAEGATQLGMAVVTQASQFDRSIQIGASEQGIEHSFLSVFSPPDSNTISHSFYAVWQPRFTQIDNQAAFLDVIEHDIKRRDSVSLSIVE